MLLNLKISELSFCKFFINLMRSFLLILKNQNNMFKKNQFIKFYSNFSRKKLKYFVNFFKKINKLNLNFNFWMIFEKTFHICQKINACHLFLRCQFEFLTWIISFIKFLNIARLNNFSKYLKKSSNADKKTKNCLKNNLKMKTKKLIEIKLLKNKKINKNKIKLNFILLNQIELVNWKIL